MSRNLSGKQRAVIDDLFEGQFDEQTVLERHNVSRSVYNRWQADARFVGEFERRLAALDRQSRLIIARYATVAAAKLVELTDSDNPETARKACLDIISMPKAGEKRTEEPDEPVPSGTGQQLSDETAGRLLAALAQTKEF